MSTDLSVLEETVAMLSGHYDLAGWARAMNAVCRQLPAAIAEIKQYRELEIPRDG